MSSVLNWQIRMESPSGGTKIFPWPVGKLELIVGRGSLADVAVDSTEVSRHHVTLQLVQSEVHAIDQGSKNGTYLDGDRLPIKVPTLWSVNKKMRLGYSPDLLILEEVVQENRAINPLPIETKMMEDQTQSHIGRLMDETQPDISMNPKPDSLQLMQQRMQSVVDKSEQESKMLRSERAQAQLQLQEIQKEIERMTLAREQLSEQLNREIKELEGKISSLKSESNQQSSIIKTKAQDEAKQIIEQAKLQAQEILKNVEQVTVVSPPNVTKTSIAVPNKNLNVTPVGMVTPIAPKPQFKPGLNKTVEDSSQNEMASEAVTRIYQRGDEKVKNRTVSPSNNVLTSQQQGSQVESQEEKTVVGLALIQDESEVVLNSKFDFIKKINNKNRFILVGSSVTLLLLVGMWRVHEIPNKESLSLQQTQMSSTKDLNQKGENAKVINPVPSVQAPIVVPVPAFQKEEEQKAEQQKQPGDSSAQVENSNPMPNENLTFAQNEEPVASNDLIQNKKEENENNLPKKEETLPSSEENKLIEAVTSAAENLSPVQGSKPYVPKNDNGTVTASLNKKIHLTKTTKAYKKSPQLALPQKLPKLAVAKSENKLVPDTFAKKINGKYVARPVVQNSKPGVQKQGAQPIQPNVLKKTVKTVPSKTATTNVQTNGNKSSTPKNDEGVAKQINEGAWKKVFSKTNGQKWRKTSTHYLRQSLKLDPKKISLYHKLENQFVLQLRTLRGPASELKRSQQEMQFATQAKKILGEVYWKKLLLYRNYFLKKNQ
ncbi:MAG: FHA domain-containing protein [Bdellovibrionales bacterium]|nr:FHA domain-containing protein [Bdellovibrionales bacterium]